MQEDHKKKTSEESIFHLGALGAGRTGREVIRLAQAQGHTVTIFDSHHAPTEENVKELDGLISFLPAQAFLSYYDLLTSIKKPLIIGTTGIQWESGLKELLTKKGATWVIGSNFSRGIQLLRYLIKDINNKIPGLFEELFDTAKNQNEIKIQIDETHHIHKLDAPSGTALTLKDWLINEVDSQSLPLASEENIRFESKRVGDVVGDHTINLDLGSESLSLGHRAHHREVFAQGALWCLLEILKGKVKVPAGLYQFSEIFDMQL